MAIKGINQVINNLKKIKKSDNAIDILFIRKSLEWIRDKANENLDKRTHHFFGSEARNWNLRVITFGGDSLGVLENQDMNSGAIEFGIGIKGLSSNMSEYGRDNYADIDSKYAFDLPSPYKNDKGYWRFYEPRTDRWYRINGYEGKSFLYDALMEYKQNNMWHIIYQQAFDEIMRSVIK